MIGAFYIWASAWVISNFGITFILIDTLFLPPSLVCLSERCEFCLDLAMLYHRFMTAGVEIVYFEILISLWLCLCPIILSQISLIFTNLEQGEYSVKA